MGSTKFYIFLGIAVAGGGTLTAIVYSRSEAVIYFWNCTAAVRVCNLTNAIIFFALSTIAILGLLYLADLIFFRRKKENARDSMSAGASKDGNALVSHYVNAPVKNSFNQSSPTIDKFFQGGLHIHPETRPPVTNISNTMDDYREEYQPHQMKKYETWESISEQEYGSTKFARRIRDANDGALYPLPTGSYINIPTIRLSSIQREDGKYVSLKVVNGNREKPSFCKAIISKMERLKDGEWFPIDADESGALSWHHGGSDKDGFKKVFLSPEFINVARLPNLTKETNLFIRQNIVFTHLVNKPHKAGRYRMLIEVQYRFGDKSRTEQWFGYLDTIDITDSDKCKLTITDFEDVNEWK